MDDIYFDNIFQDWSNCFGSIEELSISVKFNQHWYLRYVHINYSLNEYKECKNIFSLNTEHIVVTKRILPIKSSIFNEIWKRNESSINIENDITFKVDSMNKSYSPFGGKWRNENRHIPTLRMTGDSPNYDNDLFDKIKLELRSCEQPFNDINDLKEYLNIEHDLLSSSMSSVIEITLSSPLYILDSSNLINDSLSVHITADPKIDKDKIKITAKIFQGSIIERKEICIDSIRWTKFKNLIKGTIDIDWNNIHAAECYLTYKNEFVDKRLLIDPNKTVNRRYFIHKTFDSNNSLLEKLIFSEKGSRAKDLEDGIAILFSILGFNITKYGGPDQLQDAPDIIVETPDDRLALIECTISLPNKNDKLAKLVQRTKKLQRDSEKSGIPYSEIIPLLVTTLPKDDVQAHIKEAGKLGVAIVTKDIIEELIKKMSLPADSVRIYDEIKTLIPRPNGLNTFRRLVRK